MRFPKNSVSPTNEAVLSAGVVNCFVCPTSNGNLVDLAAVTLSLWQSPKCPILVGFHIHFFKKSQMLFLHSSSTFSAFLKRPFCILEALNAKLLLFLWVKVLGVTYYRLLSQITGSSDLKNRFPSRCLFYPTISYQ